MKVYSTSNTDMMFISALIYGQSKVGKTRIISTCDAPFVLNVENSLVSLRGYDIPVVNIKTVREFAEAMQYLTRSPEAKKYKTICLDSISELAELILAEEKSRTKDARQAYGNMQDEIFKVVRALTALPFDCYVIAKAEKAIGPSGETVYAPFIPSAKGAMRLPYLFDETFALRNIKLEGEREPKVWLQCYSDQQWEAGDKSGEMSMWEEPDLSAIFARIRGKTIDEARALYDEAQARQEAETAQKQAELAQTKKSAPEPILTEAEKLLKKASVEFIGKAKVIKEKALKAKELGDKQLIELLIIDWYDLCNIYSMNYDNFAVRQDVAEGIHDLLGLQKPVMIKGREIVYPDNVVRFVDEELANYQQALNQKKGEVNNTDETKEAVGC